MASDPVAVSDRFYAEVPRLLLADSGPGVVAASSCQRTPKIIS
jgi:hypothetical protein